MARLPALIDAIAACDPRGRATVEHVARVIREAKLIQTTKRGRGAAEMTEHDAVALLIGLNGSENLQDAPKAVLAFSDLIPDSDPIKGMSVPPILLPIARAKTFFSALEALLIIVPQLERLFESSLDLNRKAAKWNRAEDSTGLKVTFQAPNTAASIAVNWIDHLDGPIRRDLQLNYKPPQFRRSSSRTTRFDRAVTVSIGVSTFSQLHNALWPSEAKHHS